MYLGSKILSGTDVFGNKIKLLNGKTGMIFGSLDIIIYNCNNLKITIMYKNYK
tara:strand:- start:270 stop:428 length:159 start_codon:yes stop_codon:yes gene_type:complete